MREYYLAIALSLLVAACGGGGDKIEELEPRTTAIGVNGYLWQASLDTLSFMPITSADPAAAVIITDWYSAPATPDERVRVTVRFLTEALRADGVRVAVVRQRRQAGVWVAAQTQAATSLKIEESILTQARRLRIEVLDQ